MVIICALTWVDENANKHVPKENITPDTVR